MHLSRREELICCSNPAYGEVYSIQHYMTKCVNNLRQVNGLVSSINKTDSHYIAEILLKVVFSTITLTLLCSFASSLGVFCSWMNITAYSWIMLLSLCIIYDIYCKITLLVCEFAIMLYIWLPIVRNSPYTPVIVNK